MHLAVLTGLALLAQAAPIVSPSPPPPIDVRPAAPMLVVWEPGEIRCGDVSLDASRLLQPMSEVRGLSKTELPAASLSFSLDATGRPVSITRLGAGAYWGADLAPSLAASRFLAGTPRESCTITYAVRAAPFAEAGAHDLMRYWAQPGINRLGNTALERISGGDCLRSPRPAPLVRAFPDRRTLSELPGTYQWAVVGFDIGPTGETANARVILGGGSALETAALDAVGRSRFAAENRTGCLVPFVRRAGTLEAPPAPSRPSDGADTDPCGGRIEWETAPRPSYPEPYRKRAIEGWAQMAYDVAPWGQIGNVRVLESQPSAEFGTQARATLSMAKAKSGTGAADCRTLVRFKMNGGNQPPSADEPDGGGSL